jgi:mannose-6-phosphate isomerase-like protein (cupin superfamily)
LSRSRSKSFDLAWSSAKASRNYEPEDVVTEVSYKPRKVIAGVGPDGKNGVIEDSTSQVYLASPKAVVHELLSVPGVPWHFDAGAIVGNRLQFDPPDRGVAVRIVELYPDAVWRSAGVNPLTPEWADLADADPYDPSAATPGMHRTRSIDVITVIRGTVTAVLESETVELSAGDTLVQLGGRHAWSNRSDTSAEMVVTMIAAGRQCDG